MIRTNSQPVIEQKLAARTPCLAQANAYIRYISDRHIADIQTLLKMQQVQPIGQNRMQPAKNNLNLQVLDKGMADQWMQAIAQAKGNPQQIQPLSIYSTLGPFQETQRICRDLMNSTATRSDRILAAVRTQMAKYKANKHQMSVLDGIQICHGVFL